MTSDHNLKGVEVNSISVLVVVDTEDALSSGVLEGNVYLVDSNKFIGSWQEGTDTLHTVAQDGQIVKWRATAVAPGSDVEITDFSGNMVGDGVCRPSCISVLDEVTWEGRVETQGEVGSWVYSITVNMSGKALSFSSYLKVV